jgi:colanic acid biosynthesis protein WcaH
MSQRIPQDLYDQILLNMPIACVDVVLMSQGRAFLVRRGDAPARGLWWLPGGRVIKGERLVETALRKAKEEVGIDCVPGPIMHTEETIFPDGPSDIPVHSVNVCIFLASREDDPTPQLDDHHADWRWIDHVEDDLHPYVRRCLHAAGMR